MAFFAPSFSRLLDSPTDEERVKILHFMPAGAFSSKRTRPNRFEDLDRVTVDLVKAAKFPGEIRVHDMACSSGITSLEMLDRLSQAGTVKMRASDYYNSLYVAKRGPFHVFYDGDGNMLQVSLWRMALKSKGSNRRLARLVNASERNPIPLVDPKVAADHRIEVATDNFFDPAPRQYEVVRVMNALVEGNFPRADVERAIRAIVPTLTIGGFLILGRSADDRDRQSEATIFQRTADGFIAAADLSGGYRMREFVLSI
jgi:chemotaxis methyl-accepting protein methylase